MWVGIGSMLACRIFGSWLLCVYFGMGATGVWIAMITDWVCRTSFFVPRVISGKWKEKYKPT
jgi:Na+-driven multidrug efflux pump